MEVGIEVKDADDIPLYKPVLFTLLGGLLQFLGFTFYGVGSNLLGALGPSAGWGTFTAISIFVSNLFGYFFFREWELAIVGKKARIYFFVALGLLLVALAFLIASALV